MFILIHRSVKECSDDRMTVQVKHFPQCLGWDGSLPKRAFHSASVWHGFMTQIIKAVHENLSLANVSLL